MSHEEYKEMLALSALEALDGAEGQALQTHLATCPTCREELEEMREAASMLAHLPPRVAPPAEMRARLLEAVKTLRKQRATLGEPFVAPDHQNGAPGPASAAQPPAADVIALAERRRRALTSRPLLAFGAVAAAVTIVALAVSLATLWNRYYQVSSEVARLSERLNEAQGELAQEREAREVLEAPDVRIASLTGTKAAPGARARLVYDHQTGRAVFFAYDLPPAPSGKAYQLWFITEGRPLPGKVFTTDAKGRAKTRDKLPSQGLNASAFAVTLEPHEGAHDAPTGDRYLLSADS